MAVLVWRRVGEAPDVEHLLVRDPAATIGELAEQMGVGYTWLSIDGRPASPTSTIDDAGVRQGASVAAPPGVEPPAVPPDQGPYLHAETGLDAGRCFLLAPGAVTAGRDRRHPVSLARDPLVSQDHCQIDVRADGSVWVSDLASSNGTVVNGRTVDAPMALAPGDRLQLGATVLRFAVGCDDDPPAPLTPTTTGDQFRRPPRQYRWSEPPAVALPDLPEPRQPKPILSVAAFVTPLIFGVVMYLALHSLIFALFALLSPVAAVGTYLEGRRRFRKAKQGGGRAAQASLDTLRAEIEGQRQATEDRLCDVAGPLAVLYRRAAAPTGRLWERRPSHPDFMELRLASGAVPFVPTVSAGSGRGTASPGVQAVLEESAGRGVGTATVHLDAGWIGVCGDRAAALAIVRSLILQAATTSGPGDLRIHLSVDDDRRGDWQWLQWLPHTAGDDDGSTVMAGTRSRAGPPSVGPVTVMVVDRAVGAREQDIATAAVVVAPDVARLPDRCTTIVEVDPRGMTTIGPAAEAAKDGKKVTGVVATGVAFDTADAWARHLAHLSDGNTSSAPLPEVVDGGDLWQQLPATTGLVWRLGEDRDGPVEADLCVEGPHVVVVGVAGSGLSEAMRGLVASLSGYDTSEVVFALLDLAGGGLGAIARFPHVAGVVNDVGTPQNADGPLSRLEGEVLRRDRLIRAAGYDSLTSYLASGATPLPRLVIVIDDPGILASDRTATLEAMVRLAAANSHLGLHVALATTQPAGRVAALINDAAVRIALRLAEAPAQAFVGVPYPAGIPRSRPGRGWLKIGDTAPCPVQLALGSAPTRRRDLRVELVTATTATTTVVDELITAALARGLTPASPLWGTTPEASGIQPAVGLPALLGLDGAAGFDPTAAWQPRRAERFLRVPIGVDERGDVVELDLKEAAHDGMGPHGLVVGATGSGKSELLRTLVTALVATHPPQEMSLVLVDFKGGATFAGFADLPHVAGMITNLEQDLSGVDRMEAALLGEQQRRQELLRQAGHFGSAQEYRDRRPDLEPLPDLLVIVDEFAELLEQRPEFIDMFGSIGRLGRSLGIHLLLATQRLEEGRLRGLESHLRYRISLRTNSTSESRTVLGAPDAATLPSEPGIGYLKVDGPKLRRFRAALVSAPAGGDRSTSAPCGQPDSAHGRPSRFYTAPNARSDMEVLTASLRGRTPRTHQVWLPVLPATLSLADLAGPIAVQPGRGLQATVWDGPGDQRVPLGIIDRPRQQCRTTLIADFAGAAGHLVVVGSPRSGKTTMLRTVAASLALTHTPGEATIYGLDFAGGGLASVAGLPHAGGIAHQGDPELVARVVSHVTAVLRAREQLFRELDIDSPGHFRRLRAGGHLVGDHGDVYLLVDGWGGLRSASEVLEQQITDLAKRGLGYGVHLVLTASRWADLRPALRDAVVGRLELRLSEPSESAFDRRAASNVPPGAPGRGITEDGHHFLAALPVLTGDDEGGGWISTVAKIGAAWTRPGAPVVRTLPAVVAVSELAASASGLPIGVAEPDMAPLVVDPLGTDQHLLVLGDSASGKTTLLRTLVTQLVARNSSEQVRILIVDPRRNLLELVPPPHLFGYVGSGPAAATQLARLRVALEERLPGPDISAQQLRNRSWWAGPEAFVIVDDHDLVVTQTTNPLLPLVDLLAQASDIGLHLIVARRVAGWQRAQFEPVIQRLREIGATTILMSGDPAEGIVANGVRAVPRPPGRAALMRYRENPVMIQVAHSGELDQP